MVYTIKRILKHVEFSVYWKESEKSVKSEIYVDSVRKCEICVKSTKRWIFPGKIRNLGIKMLKKHKIS